MAKRLWGLMIVVLLDGLLPACAHSQRFFPMLPANPRDRLQTATYLAQWEFPPIPGDELPESVASETLRPSAGPLLTVDYFLGRHLSIGGWWNRVSGDISMRELGGERDLPVATTDADFSDLHVTYYFPERQGNGWSIQAGYSRLHYDVKLISGLQITSGEPGYGVTFTSPNVWINRTQRIGLRRIGGRRRSMRVFGSLGYHSSTDFKRAWNLMLGGTVPLSQQLSFSGSVWFNRANQTSTRVTVGLTGSF